MIRAPGPAARGRGAALRAAAWLALPLAVAGTGGAGAGESALAAGIRFVDVAEAAGLGEPTWCGSRTKPHILESGGTGLALSDLDGDGDLDLYLINGWRTEGREVLERGRNRLYRNRGDGTFEDATDASGTGDDGWATGIAVGDADGDGAPDLFVSNFGPDVLFLNNGDGTFRRAEDGPGIDGWSTGAAFFDADGDGDEDLYLGAYIDCSLDDVLGAVPALDWEGTKVMIGPFGLEGAGNRYFENLGGGRFRDVTEEAGLSDVGLFYSFGVAALDLDGDLDLDLYVANDSNPNYLYRNDGGGRFREVGLWSGAALDEGGKAQAGMGLAAGDVESDGLADLFVTNFHRDASTLYRNLGDLVFEDVTRATGIFEPTFQPLSWGTVLADFDLDGGVDLFIANGHIYPQADEVPAAGTSYRQRNLLLTSAGERFADATAGAGPGLEVEESSRGVAAGDIDGDGDLDLAIANVDAPPTLLRNDSARAGSWLAVDAPQARLVAVEAGGRRWVGHRVIGASYVSASDPRFHFGLGRLEGLEPAVRVTVTWPDGTVSAFGELPANRVVSIARADRPR